MRLKQLSLRCYAEQKGALWVAICVDLGLAAQADSFDEVRVKLHAQIGEYVYDALCGEDQDHAAELLFSRKASLEHRAKYYFAPVLNKLNGLQVNIVEKFKEVLPVGPTYQPC